MKIISTTILVLLLVTIVVPVGYLAWRADQPMELPQFKGYTYDQYLNWRKDALHQMAVKYQTAHPNAKMGGGIDACFNVDTAGDLGLKLPLAGFYTLAGIFPSLQNNIQKSDRQFVPKDVTLLTFLPNWWQIFESFVWDSASHAPATSVAYCRLEPNIPALTSLNP
jgi:hypothetical protein